MPEIKTKIEEYITELEMEIDKLMLDLEVGVNRMNLTYVSCVKTRIDSYKNFINKLNDILR
jgi:hypothetical protein